MKQRIYVFALFIFSTIQASAQLYIGFGATVAAGTSGIPIITLQDIGLINNGQFIPSESDFWFKKGVVNSDKTIGGFSFTTFDNLYVDMDNLWLTLLQEINVEGSVNFLSGQCNLNGKTVTLKSAFIAGENNASSFVGPGGGAIWTSVILNAPSKVNPGNIGAQISSSKDLGEVTIRRSHIPVSSGGGESINRKYVITAANNSDLDATLRLFYFEKELNGTPEVDLDLWRKEGSDWKWYTNGYIPLLSLVDHYFEQPGIDALGATWTLGDLSYVPVINLDQGQLLSIGDVFPNPSGNSSSLVQFQVNSPRDLDLQLRVIDPLGRIVHQQVQPVYSGNQYVSLETLDWSPGMYIIQLETGQETAQLKLNKL